MLYEEMLSIDISQLKKGGYIVHNQATKGNIGRVVILVNLKGSAPYIKINDQCIAMVAKPSNLGKGQLWYFKCPLTGKLCRKLYSEGGYFLHREVFADYLYQSQTHSHKTRQLYKQLNEVIQYEDACKAIHSKHFTKYYNGKPTKRYAKMLGQF